MRGSPSWISRCRRRSRLAVSGSRRTDTGWDSGERPLRNAHGARLMTTSTGATTLPPARTAATGPLDLWIHRICHGTSRRIRAAHSIEGACPRRRPRPTRRAAWESFTSRYCHRCLGPRQSTTDRGKATGADTGSAKGFRAFSERLSRLLRKAFVTFQLTESPGASAGTRYSLRPSEARNGARRRGPQSRSDSEREAHGDRTTGGSASGGTRTPTRLSTGT
jgi:hypothetical protein